MQKAAKTIPAKNVDEYLKSLPAAVQTTLKKVRQTIKAAAPKAEEVISYQIPMYKYNGPLVAFAAFSGHCSLFVINKNILKISTKSYYHIRLRERRFILHLTNQFRRGLFKKLSKQESRKMKRELL